MANLGNLHFDLDLRNQEFLKKLKEAEIVSEETMKKIARQMKLGDAATKSILNQERVEQSLLKTQLAHEKVGASKQASVNRTILAEQRKSNLIATNARQEELHAFKVLRAQESLNQARERANSSIGRMNNSLLSQNRILSELKTAAGAYISIWAAGRFVRTLVDISGEFELQRTTLKAILQDAEKAETIYGQIKELSVVSPFQFKDLMTYTKQLSAFSVPVNELYDTTKMLADVSAGLGVGMDRIILAYGQVRSAAVLRGQELRQFTEAGIPLVDELAKKFTKLKGEVVSAGDVFELISSRQVPFEMIKEIFEDMTREGGKFYKMQEVQAETLKGKVSNLKDAYHIMLSEIGERGDGILKGSVDTLRWLMEHYDKIGQVIRTLILTYGAYKAGLIAIITYQKALMLVTQIREWHQMSKAIGTATANAIAFGRASRSASAASAIGLIVGAVALVASTLWTAYENATKLNRELNKVSSETKANADVNIRELDNLIERIKKAEKGSENWRDAVNTLNRKYGEFLPTQITVANSFYDIEKAASAARVAILLQARATSQTKGEEKINEKLVSDTEKAYQKIRTSFKFLNIDDVRKYSLIEKYIGISKENSDSILSDIVSFRKKVYDMLVVDLGKKNVNQSILFPLVDGMHKLALSGKEADDAITAFTKKQDILYGNSTNIKKAIDEENKAHEQHIKNLKAKKLEKDAFDKEVENAQIQHYERLQKIYKDNGLALTDKAKEIDKDLEALRGSNLSEWKKTISALSGDNVAIKPNDSDNTVIDYINRVRETYKTLKEEYSEYITLTDAGSKKTAESHKKTMEEMERVAKSAGFSLDPKSEKAASKQSLKDDKASEKAREEAIKKTIEQIGNQVKEYSARYDIWKKLFETSGKMPKMNFDVNFGGQPDLKEFIKLKMQELGDKKLNLNVDFMTAEFKDILGDSDIDENKLKAIRDYFNELKKISVDEYDNNQKLLKEYETYAEKRLAIDKKLNEYLVSLEKQRNKENSEAIDKKKNQAIKNAKEDIVKIQKDVLNKYGLDEFISDGDVSDFVKKKIKASLPLFKGIATATLSELNKIDEVLNGLELPEELIIDFKEAGGDITRLLELLEKAKSSGKGAVDERKINKIIEQINKVVSSVQKLSAALENSGNKLLSSIGAFVGGLSKGFDDVLSLYQKGDKATNFDKISTGISGFATILDTINTSVSENKKAQDEWNAAIADSVQKMRLLNIEKLAYKQNSIFGMDNPIAPAIAGIKQYYASMRELLDMTDKLENGYVQTGNKRVPKGSAYAGFVSGGAGIGAAAGSIIPGIGTVVGAIAGGLAGGIMAGISSLFGSKASTKLVPVFSKLKDVYGEIYNDKFELNPKIIADYKKLDEETKKIVDNWGEIQRKAQEAQKQIEDTLKGITGTIGEDLYSALIEAFDNNDLNGALEKFRTSVNQILSDFAARMLFNSIFEDLLKAGEKRMKESLAPGGDQDITDDIDWLADEMEKNIPIFEKGMEVISNKLGSFGRKLDFGKKGKSENSLTRQIQGLTEDTGQLLGSYVNAIRYDTSKIREYVEKGTIQGIENYNLMGQMQAKIVEIAANTNRNADAADDIKSMFQSVINGTKKVSVN